MDEEQNADDDLLVDTLTSSDLDLLEKKLKLVGIRNNPFDPQTFNTNPQFYVVYYYYHHHFGSNHEIEITTSLNLLPSLCRFYD